MEREYFYEQIAELTYQNFKPLVTWLFPEQKAKWILKESLNYEAVIFTAKGCELAALLGYYANGCNFFDFKEEKLRKWLTAEEYCQSKKRLEQWQSSCKKDTFYVEALCTDALHRRQGLAEYLLLLAEKKAKECGLKRMALEVADNNYPAMALYLKCGFTCKYKRRTPCDFTHYECRLWLEKTLS